MTINVRIEAGHSSLRATVTGEIEKRLTNIYSTLDLNENSVLKAIRKMDGSRQYNKFFFACMMKCMSPESRDVDVVEEYDEPLVMCTRTFRNDSSDMATYDARLSHADADTLALSWSRSDAVSEGFEIGFNVNLTGKAAFNFSNTVGESEQRTRSVTVSADHGVTAVLRPGQKKRASLHVTRRVLKLRVNYKVTFSGDVVGTCTDHCNYTFDLNDILRVAKRPRCVTMSEIILIKYYTDGEVVLTDLY